MDLLTGFAQKDMIEKITALDEIQETGQVEAIPQLFELYAVPAEDSAVDEMVYHTLYGLLTGREQEILVGLKHDSTRVRLICARQAGESLVEGAKGALLDLLKVEKDPDVTGELVRTLGRFKDQALVPGILPYLDHADSSVVAWAMQALVEIGGDAARKALKDVVAGGAEGLAANAVCELRTALAVENVAELADQEVIAYLVGHVHHPNPSFRRVVINALAGIGTDALDALEKCLANGDKDERIMVANIIGMMGENDGADILMDFLDDEDDLDGNIKFAIYEALGRINSIKCVVGLADGLTETDPMVLMSVIIGMDNLCNPGIVKAINSALAGGGEQGALIAKTIANAHAEKLFAALYDGPHGDTLINTVIQVGDKVGMAAFRNVLEGIGGGKAAGDIKKLDAGDASTATRTGKVLAADDSKAINFFYKGVANEMGVEMITVPDGKDAFDYLQVNTDINLLITDMNMPVMDGVELTRKLRGMAQWKDLPIIMATTESDKDQVALAREAGVSDFLSKPFTGEQLKEKINQYLP